MPAQCADGGHPGSWREGRAPQGKHGKWAGWGGQENERTGQELKMRRTQEHRAGVLARHPVCPASILRLPPGARRVSFSCPWERSKWPVEESASLRAGAEKAMWCMWTCGLCFLCCDQCPSWLRRREGSSGTCIGWFQAVPRAEDEAHGQATLHAMARQQKEGQPDPHCPSRSLP